MSNKGEFLKTQTCILKVNVHCDGCKHKVKKILQKIDGVYTTIIDTENGKVTVSGNVHPATLIKKLSKAGKHAELLFPKGGGEKKGQQLNGQLEKLLLAAGKGGQIKDDRKPQKGGNAGGQKTQQPNPLQQLQQSLMFKNLNFPQLKDPKDQKSVKFVLPEEEEEDGSDFDDEFDDELDGFDGEFDDELDGFDDDFEEGIKDVKPKVMNGGGLPPVNQKKGGGGGGGDKNKNANKGGGGDANKGADKKNGNSGGKKNGSGGGGGKKEGGGGGSGAPQDGKNGGNKKAAANGNKNNKNNENTGGGKQSGGKGGAAGLGGPPMNHQAMMAQMANMNIPMGIRPVAAVQGLPAAGAPGFFPGGAITPEMAASTNPYQQQYIAAMMQQQRMMMNGQGHGYQPMAYARPPPMAAYMAPPPEYTHLFSDENTNSCAVM